ncbi:MAG TPA: HAD family phosphatase [Chthoniobacterales bacterium]|jgi:putative hydrolase of the HAD superfamily|nr:HAD family phosphatase [Chthoniobacterales bacterium]
MQGTPTKVRTKLVLFDIGGVIIDLDFRDARSTLESEFLMDPETFLELTRSGYAGEVLSVTEKAMIGAIGTDEYLGAFQTACKSPVPLETVERLRASMLGPERPEMLEFLDQLRRYIPIAAFTNTIALHWDLLMDPKRYRFPQLFSTIFASHLLGDAKPRVEAFEKVLNALSLNPEEVVFIDDSDINVSGASQLGVKGIVFESPESLRTELRNYVEF